MLTNKMKRAGLVLSAVWMIFGGYFIYLQFSNQDFKRTVRSICSMDAKACSDIAARSSGMFATDWTSITIYIVLGLAAIWIALLAVGWIQRGNSEK